MKSRFWNLWIILIVAVSNNCHFLWQLRHLVFAFVSEPIIKKIKLSKEDETNSTERLNKSTNRSTDIINISDGEEENDELPQDGYELEPKYYTKYLFLLSVKHFCCSFDNGHEQVTSSTECFRADDNYKENSENSMQQLDQPYCDAVEKVRIVLYCGIVICLFFCNSWGANWKIYEIKKNW